jgi:membrane protease YdiL (CAAX protease family)
VSGALASRVDRGVTSRSRLPPTVRAVIWIGGIMFWAVLLTLLLAAGLPVADSILLAVLLVALPAFSIAQLPLMRGASVERLPAYWGSIATLWLLGGACWLAGVRKDGPSALGIVGLAPVGFVLWSLGLAGGGLLIIFVFRELAVWTGMRESYTLRELLPRTRRERGVFALLAVAAGVSEELAYRGYAIPMLAPWLGVGGAAALSSTIFGVLHGYQGVLGTVRTTLMGGMLAWGFLTAGSLWPAIVAHTVIDLVAGIVLGERLLPPDGLRGVTDRELL